MYGNRAPKTVADMEVGVEVDIQVHGGGIDRLGSLGRCLYVEHSDLLHQFSEESPLIIGVLICLSRHVRFSLDLK